MNGRPPLFVDDRQTWARARRASRTPLLALVFVVTIIASTLTLAFSAAVATESRVDMVAPSLGETTAFPSEHAAPAAVRASNTWASPVARARQQRLLMEAPRTASDSSGEWTDRDDPSVTSVIAVAALEFGVDAETMLRRAFCESSYNPNAVGRAQEVSLFQFLPSTWVVYAPHLGYTLREIGHVEAQARVAAYMESIGEGRQWACR